MLEALAYSAAFGNHYHIYEYLCGFSLGVSPVAAGVETKMRWTRVRPREVSRSGLFCHVCCGRWPGVFLLLCYF